MKKKASKNFGWFLILLTMFFVRLKVQGKIDWSWFWVLSPWIALQSLTVAVMAFWNRCLDKMNKEMKNADRI